MDAIERLFADITPEHFHRETSAIDDASVHLDACSFDEFVNQLVSITFRRASEKIEFSPFAVLRNDARQRIFLADGDETPDAWAKRLHREATDMDASWFFVALLSPGRTYEGDRPEDIPRTDADIDAALDDGRLKIALAWLAVGDDGDRAGLISLDDKGMPGECTEGEIDGEGNPFMQVLGGDRAV